MIELLNKTLPSTQRGSRNSTLIRYEIPLLCCMALIVFLSSRPALPGPGERGSLIRDIFNYGGHVVMYALLAFLAWRVVVVRAGELPFYLIARPRLTAVLFCLVYGILDEFHQSFVPGRTASAYDVLADVIGAILAMTAITYWYRRHGMPLPPGSTRARSQR